MDEAKWDLGRLNAGELSALRRAAGTTVGKADMTALRAFYKACGYCDPRREAYWFPAMCMDALWRDPEGCAVNPMAQCLWELQNADERTTASVQHRVDMLLETAWSDDGFLVGKLLNLVRLVKSRTALKPDFQALADDLMRWNSPDRRVQRDWLRTLYNVKESKPSKEDAENVD